MSSDTSELTGSSGGQVPAARPGGPGPSTGPGAQRPGVPAGRTAPVRPAGLASPPPPAPAPVRRPGRPPWLPGPATGDHPGSGGSPAGAWPGRRAALAASLRTIFRLPKMDDPNPGARHLALVCGWAVALGILGLLTAVRAFVAIYTVAPDWYGPAVSVAGLSGTALTIGALFAVQWHRLAKLLLTLATAALVVVLVLTGLA